MKSITTKSCKYGWYYTFRKRKDKTIIIERKNKKHNNYECQIHIFGEENLKAFMKVIKKWNIKIQVL